MQVLFVRHGESDTNSGDTFLHDPELTEKGRRQAVEVSSRLAKLKVRAIYTSPLKRARDTALQIAHAHHCPLIESASLVERVRPSSMFGMTKNTPQYIQIHDEYHHAFSAGEQYEDAESYSQILQRVLFAQTELCTQNAGTLVVVSHGYFIRAFIGHVLFGSRLTSQLLADIRQYLRSTNTGITEFEVENTKWHLITVNDYSHLSAELASFSDK